jgi:glycosyltransferase involved in cell wall biosynthesis
MTALPSLLVLTSTLPRFAGDPEPRFVLDLSKHLGAYFRVTILAPADPAAAAEEMLEGVRVVRYRYAPLRRWEKLAYPGAILPRLKRNPLMWALVPLLCLGLYMRASRLLRQESFACVHSHWLMPQGVLAALLGTRFNIPFVVTSHGADVFALRSRFSSFIRRWTLRKAAVTTVVSEAIRRQLQQEFPDVQSEVISMGVDCDRFHPARRRESWAAEQGLTRPVVAFVGRLSEKKGVEFLLQALALPALANTQASLAIVGDGELRDALAAEVRRLGIGRRVKFLGALPHDQLPLVMASADIFCAPSIIAADGDREGLPTVICEAAASGLPAVATRVSGNEEIIVDGVTGLLVAQRDPQALAAALQRLIEDESTRRELSAAALHGVQRFAWPQIAARFANALTAAAATRSNT